MKSVIPFTKDLDFSTKISEITSISLERDFEVEDTSVEGNLYVTGEYKSHEISANVLPFSYKIPFTIEIPENLSKESIGLEICDFAYEIPEEEKIKVSIELELTGDIIEIEESEEEPIIEVDSDAILEMIEENIPTETEREEEPIWISPEECEPNEEEIPFVEEKEERNEELAKETEDVVLNNVNLEEEEYKTYHIHMVKEGDTIETICTFYNSNLNILSEYNDVTNISLGDKIIIPENDES